MNASVIGVIGFYRDSDPESKYTNNRMSHLSDRFRLESVIAYLGNEKTKLSNKAATLRAADPVTSLEERILPCLCG
jgi:hypothetical protein